MPKATIDFTPSASPSDIIGGGGELLTLRLDQIILDPITDVRSGPVAKDEEAKIDSLARTIYQQGQLQPVVVRPNGADGKYLLIAGRRRYAAAQLIERESKAPWPLQAYVVIKNDEDAYSAAIQENLQRRQFSPIELATQITEIRKRMNFNGDDWTKHVAEFLHVSRATISQHSKLLELPAKIQNKVHSGVLSAQSAFELAAVEESHREAVLAKAEQMAEAEAQAKPAKAAKTPKTGKNGASSEAEAPAEVGKVKHKHVVAAAREAEAMTQFKPRSRNELLSFFTNILESADGYSEPVVKFCQTLVNKWATGEVSDRVLLNRLNELDAACEDKAAKTKAVKKAK